MTAKRARKRKPKARPPADLPEPLTVRVKPHSYQPSKTELDEDVKIETTPRSWRVQCCGPSSGGGPRCVARVLLIMIPFSHLAHAQTPNSVQ